MATLQVKNVPDDLHAELRRRAEAEHATLRDYVLRILAREARRPTMTEWLDDVLSDEPVLDGPSSAELVRQARDEA